MTNVATIRCWGCRETVTLDFHLVATYVKEHWEGICPGCGTKNYLYRPSWDQPPIFRKYNRKYLAEVTGYSREYLSRLATGKTPLGQVFIDRCCYTLKESEEALFTNKGD